MMDSSNASCFLHGPQWNNKKVYIVPNMVNAYVLMAIQQWYTHKRFTVLACIILGHRMGP